MGKEPSAGGGVRQLIPGLWTLRTCSLTTTTTACMPKNGSKRSRDTDSTQGRPSKQIKLGKKLREELPEVDSYEEQHPEDLDELRRSAVEAAKERNGESHAWGGSFIDLYFASSRLSPETRG